LSHSNLHGILPAAVTPFDDEENFAPAPFERLLERLYTAGCDGVYVCGQTGEGLLQPTAQRQRVTEVAVKNSPAGKQVIVHVGAYRTADAVELAKHARKVGATAVSSLPPIGPYSFPEIRQYYEAIAAASDLPLLVYYYPEVAPGIATEEQILELCGIPNVVGLKFTDFNLYRLRHLKNKGAVVYNGRDEILAAGLLMGADGGIGTFYNLAPESFVEIWRLARAGEWAAAVALQDRVNALIRATIQFPFMSAVKLQMQWSGLDCGRPLRPRRDLTPDEERRLRELLSVV
jgi:N-acetylneuraminate lyase